MINNPGINDILAELDTLKNVLADFARREEQLNQQYRARCTAELSAHDARLRMQEQKLADFSTHAESQEGHDNDAETARYKARTNRVYATQAAMKKRMAGELDALDGQLGNAVREQTALGERQRDEALAQDVARYGEFSQKLVASRDTLDTLYHRAYKAFRGFLAFRRLLSAGQSVPGPKSAGSELELYEQVKQLTAKTTAELDRFAKLPVPRIFGLLPLRMAGMLFFAVGVASSLLQTYHHDVLPPVMFEISAITFLLIEALYWYGRSTGRPLASEIAGHITTARKLLGDAFEKSEAHHQAEQVRIRQECETAIWTLNQSWKEQTRELAAARTSQPLYVDEKTRQVARKCEQYYRAGLDRIKRRYSEGMTQLRQQTTAEIQVTNAAYEATSAELKRQHQSAWQTLQAEWQAAIGPLHHSLEALTARADQLFPAWEAGRWENWEQPAQFTNAAKLGRLEVTLKTFADALPKDPRLVFPGATGTFGASIPATLTVPLLLSYPRLGSILFQTGPTGTTEAIAAINNLIFRLLSTTPPGKLSFTIFDPVGLGENFAALMHLADYEESAINSRIWTQTTQFEEKLAELNEHMEKVIQMYLRNDYATIAEYNAEAGTMAEKYHFLVIASFPVNFSDTAARRLRNIIASGARCGVYVFIQWDQRTPLPQDLLLDDLKNICVCLAHTASGFKFSNRELFGAQIFLDAPPSPEFATQFLHKSGKQSKNSTRVEVPFQQIAPPENDIWTESTVEELRVPIGRSGATKLQYLAIGKGTRQHALIAGKTGSGKSTLFHVIITNLALWCSPEQVEFYLVDFKKGVEFKCYGNRRLPHARVVAIESDRAFGLSVLQRVDEELRRRGELFRQYGAQDLAGYHRGGGTEPLPRSLLMIDEFQEFFTEEDRISQGAAVLLDRIIRQGRAFGIHVLLGSQTLGGAYTLARATIGQMVIRIALQCNETDAYLIMDQDNPAPRLLSRPGEGIYNDTAGSIEGNSPFQAVWLDDQIRDGFLAKVRARADRQPDQYPGPIIFEGSAPAEIRENLLLRQAIAAVPAAPPDQSRIWLGAPNAIKGPTEVVFKRQSGNNLLLVGQSDERTLTMLSVALLTLSAQYPRQQTRFIVLDSTPPGFPQRDYFQTVIQAVPHEVIQVNNANLAEVMAGLAEELKQRGGENATTPGIDTFILIQGLQNFKKLRAEDEFGFGSSDAGAGPNPANVLLDLITEGPARGFHVLATIDTFNNVNRCLGRKALSEFEMRVLFQMSAGDSASLIDSPDAGNLGFHRALLYLDREGLSETFRPYAQPGSDWLAEVQQALTKRP